MNFWIIHTVLWNPSGPMTPNTSFLHIQCDIFSYIISPKLHDIHVQTKFVRNLSFVISIYAYRYIYLLQFTAWKSNHRAESHLLDGVSEKGDIFFSILLAYQSKRIRHILHTENNFWNTRRWKDHFVSRRPIHSIRM